MLTTVKAYEKCKVKSKKSCIFSGQAIRTNAMGSSLKIVWINEYF